jgi:RNA polymerase sigma factor (sigma-70 family)
MITDASLLNRYVTGRSDAAFAELVQRHLPLVYFTALRRLHGDSYRARDVAQIVFTQLARQASALSTHSSLVGWLYTTTRNTSARIVREEIRRATREKEAQAMLPDPNDFAPTANWDRIRPTLDDALAQLKAKDREALLMRFFGGLSYAQIADAQELSEDAARMRINRALERLRGRLIRCGVTSTAAALAEALSTQTSLAAPAGLPMQITQAALWGAAAPASALSYILMSTTTTKMASAVVLIGLGLIVWQHRINQQLGDQVASLAQKSREIKSLRAEDRRLSELADLSRPLESAPGGSLPLRTSNPTSESAAWAEPVHAASASATVQLTPSGGVAWDGKPVTLQDFIADLRDYHGQHPDRSEQLLIDVQGAPGSQVAYLFDEARKAGIRSVWFAPGSQAPEPVAAANEPAP